MIHLFSKRSSHHNLTENIQHSETYLKNPFFSAENITMITMMTMIATNMIMIICLDTLQKRRRSESGTCNHIF